MIGCCGVEQHNPDVTTASCALLTQHSAKPPTSIVPGSRAGHVHHQGSPIHLHSLRLLTGTGSALGVVALREGRVEAQPLLHFEPKVVLDTTCTSSTSGLTPLCTEDIQTSSQTTPCRLIGWWHQTSLLEVSCMRHATAAEGGSQAGLVCVCVCVCVCVEVQADLGLLFEAASCVLYPSVSAPVLSGLCCCPRPACWGVYGPQQFCLASSHNGDSHP